MDQRIIDLHVHSTESDGTLTPVELIAAAKEAGLSAIALTDHDTCSGIKKAAEAAPVDVEAVLKEHFATNATKKWLLPCKKKVFRSPWKPCSPKIRTV